MWYVYMSRSSPHLNLVGNLPESKEASGPSSTRKTMKMMDVNVLVPARRRANDDDARVECSGVSYSHESAPNSQSALCAVPPISLRMHACITVIISERSHLPLSIYATRVRLSYQGCTSCWIDDIFLGSRASSNSSKSLEYSHT